MNIEIFTHEASEVISMYDDVRLDRDRTSHCICSNTCMNIYTQIISLVDKIFAARSLRLWLRPYAIVCVGHQAGLVECITDAKSVDEIKKKTPNYTNMRVSAAAMHRFEYIIESL